MHKAWANICSGFVAPPDPSDRSGEIGYLSPSIGPRGSSIPTRPMQVTEPDWAKPYTHRFPNRKISGSLAKTPLEPHNAGRLAIGLVD